MKPSLETLSLNIEGINIAGIRQRDKLASNQPCMLCVHGWLDNANSFVPMMPYLPAFDLVAIDLPGNGHSDALSDGYHIHELSFLLYQIIQALNWTSCHIVGHSLGGGLLPMLAVAKPATFESMTMIEAVGSLTESADKLPARLSKAFNDRLDSQRFESRIFPDKQAAIDARLKAAKMHPASAKLIIDRQLRPIDNGYAWAFDKRWRHASFQYQTEEHVRAVLSKVTCPTLAILADEGYLHGRKDTEERLACLQDLDTIMLTGHHHLHMDTPEPVAAAINRFLQATPALG